MVATMFVVVRSQSETGKSTPAHSDPPKRTRALALRRGGRSQRAVRVGDGWCHLGQMWMGPLEKRRQAACLVMPIALPISVHE